MYTLTFFYVRATNDVWTFHVPYLSFLSSFSGAAFVSWEEAKRKQKGYRRRLTNEIGHRQFIARIYNAGWHRKRRKVHLLKRFLKLKTIHKCFLLQYKTELNAMLHRIPIFTNTCEVTMQVKRAIGKATFYILPIHNEYMLLYWVSTLFCMICCLFSIVVKALLHSFDPGI